MLEISNCTREKDNVGDLEMVRWREREVIKESLGEGKKQKILKIKVRIGEKRNKAGKYQKKARIRRRGEQKNKILEISIRHKQ